MAISTQPSSLTAEYRYFIHDLVTNDFLVELPLRGVSFGRSLREAGSFQGDIPVIDATYNLDLYNTTLPGKRAIYVTRDGVCVWGGIIWSRNYNIKDKILSIQASEFTSYLYHRVAWRTWSNEYEAKLEIIQSGGEYIGKATLTNAAFDFTVGMPVYLVFGLDSNRKHDGYYYVVNSPSAPTDEVFYFKRKDDTSLSNVTERVDTYSTVAVRQDTYQYTRDLLESLKGDFFELEFPNSEIEPAAEFFQTIISASRTSNVATLTLDAAHGLVVGQRVTITDLDIDASFNGRYVVTAVTANTFSYANVGSNVSNTSLTPNTKTVLYAQRNESGTVTLTTSGSHGFTKDDLVTISDVNGSIDGLHVITSVPSSTTFQFNTFYATEIAFSSVKNANTNPTATVAASVKFSTYGEFSANSGLDIDYSTDGLSPQDPRVNPLFRGAELKYVGEILDSYSNVQNGFEYRIDASYDPTTRSFKKTFVFLPLVPQSLQTYLTGLLTVKSSVDGYYSLPQDGNSVNDARKVLSTGLTYVWNGVAWVYTGGIGVMPAGTTAPPAAFGADRLVFEHPGNILDATMEESAEDSATRFWVQGADDTGNSDASLPYAAETAIDYLKDGWPLLDQVEKVDEVSEEETLYIHARQFLKEAKPPISYFSISINGSAIPEVGTFAPGDWCSVILDDSFVRLRLASPLEPNSGSILLRKIEAYDIQVPDAPSLPEQVNIQLISDGTIESIGGVRLNELGS
jgi:hypothetical protein